MGRGKLSMELIMNKKTRNTTYQNRKKGIIKKANELSVLCDVNTLIIFCPPDSNHPDIWCQNPDQINSTIRAYKQEKNKNGKRLTCDLGDYFQSRKRKIEDQLIKSREKNREAKYPTCFDNLNGLSDGQLRHIIMGLERKQIIATAHFQLKKTKFNVPTPFGFDVGNNQLTQVQALMSHGDVGRTDVYAAANPYMGLNPSLDHALEWTNDEPTTSCVQLNPGMGISFNYPVSEGEMVYETSEPCEYQLVQLEPEMGICFDYPVSEGEVVYKTFEPCEYQPVQVEPQMGIRFNYPVSYDKPSTSSVQPEPEMGIKFNYPVSEGEVVYETSEPCEYQLVQVEPQMGIKFNYPVSDGKPTTSSVQPEPEMGIKFDHPNSEGEVVYETCEYQAVEQCCPMAEKSALEKSDDGVGIEEFVIEDDDLAFLMDMDLDDDSMIEFVNEDDLGLLFMG